MDIEKRIMRFLEKDEEVKSFDIVKITGFSRTYVNRFFQRRIHYGGMKNAIKTDFK